MVRGEAEGVLVTASLQINGDRVFMRESSEEKHRSKKSWEVVEVQLVVGVEVGVEAEEVEKRKRLLDCSSYSKLRGELDLTSVRYGDVPGVGDGVGGSAGMELSPTKSWHRPLSFLAGA